ncbi:MAG: FtsX-like permease family protein [Candidatus Poseidoniaceae archaeon]|nr:FtsX-like permease family protein [Candidatus Poseidoniaceae archaeon]
MSKLLNKRLARSLWRTKLRLIAVVLMVFVGVFAGITFGGYSQSLDNMYDTLQGDSEDGGNLADLWLDNRSAVWTPEQVSSFCNNLSTGWEDASAELMSLDSCEGRTILQGALFHNDSSGERIINSLWHGIPADANADRVWLPEGHSEGRTAVAYDEIVIDAHVAEVLEIELQDTVRIGAGGASANFTVVGIGFHPLHVMMAPEGTMFPPEIGEFVVGYLSDSGMARLTGESLGSSNTIILEIDGTPSFDLPNTGDYEGDEIDAVKAMVGTAMDENNIDARVRDRGQNEPIELLRQDLEGAKRTTIPFTVMIAVIASITIVLSLQRLVQSQSREIAVLRTLGVDRTSLMTGYLMAPLFIGAIGCGLGALAGPSGMNGMLDFYQNIIGIPIVDRAVPTSVYTTVIGLTMLVVFLSGAFPAWKASRLEPLEILGGHSEMRVGSNFLKSLTSWMPTTLGLSIRSSFRKPIRLIMTFIAVGISLMLFGSIQMMSAGLEETLVGGLEEQQSWDQQVYIMPDGESGVIDWANDNNASFELIIETQLGMLVDGDGVDRIFTLVGLDSYEQNTGMRSVEIIEGTTPSLNPGITEVIMDEGAMAFLSWKVGEQHQVLLNGDEHDVEIVGSSRGEMARTMYFLRSDLSDIVGVNATSVYLDLPDGVEVDNELGELSAGLVGRQTLLDGIESILEQQTQIFQSMMYLGLMFTIVVMFNTMVMNVAERDFELATLRVLGASLKSLGLMLLFESLMIGLLGGLVGVLFAYGGAVGLAASFSTWQFHVPVVLVPNVAYLLMGGVLAIAVAMTPIGVWRLRQMDLIEKIKDLSN